MCLKQRLHYSDMLLKDQTSPLITLEVAWNYRYLIWQMTKREVVGRYRGSILGVVWSFLNPIFMLAIYVFVFSFVLKARWGAGEAGSMEFALFLFAGLIIYSIFSECVSKAPLLVVGNPNYVKKVIFPLEILPIVSMVSVLIHGSLSFLVLFVAQLIIQNGMHWTVVFLPIILMPLVIFTLGASWFLASIGVYVRDVPQFVGLITTVLMFVSPVFYPATALPEEIRPLLFLNPLTFIIEQTRDVVLIGNTPAWVRLILYSIVSILVGVLGFIWFQKTRKGFADVI